MGHKIKTMEVVALYIFCIVGIIVVSFVKVEQSYNRQMEVVALSIFCIVGLVASFVKVEQNYNRHLAEEYKKSLKLCMFSKKPRRKHDRYCKICDVSLLNSEVLQCIKCDTVYHDECVRQRLGNEKVCLRCDQ